MFILPSSLLECLFCPARSVVGVCSAQLGVLECSFWLVSCWHVCSAQLGVLERSSVCFAQLGVLECLFCPAGSVGVFILAG